MTRVCFRLYCGVQDLVERRKCDKALRWLSECESSSTDLVCVSRGDPILPYCPAVSCCNAEAALSSSFCDRGDPGERRSKGAAGFVVPPIGPYAIAVCCVLGLEREGRRSNSRDKRLDCELDD